MNLLNPLGRITINESVLRGEKAIATITKIVISNIGALSAYALRYWIMIERSDRCFGKE
jgi:hypothetical protein